VALVLCVPSRGSDFFSLLYSTGKVPGRRSFLPLRDPAENGRATLSHPFPMTVIDRADRTEALLGEPAVAPETDITENGFNVAATAGHRL
jgi:hypothetical protein